PYNKVVGTSGLYNLKNEEVTTCWLGWFCIDPTIRGHGLGRKLLIETINIAKQQGCLKLKLYTSELPQEAKAQILYEKLGLKIVTKTKRRDGIMIYFREKYIGD
ncbi:MAG: GNAT family N-acetyltransferase, partial [Oligoflexia bacterium]|nr:GNAT family N-acetyltransferase [Oligoflexia bacterium]